VIINSVGSVLAVFLTLSEDVSPKVSCGVVENFEVMLKNELRGGRGK
jgi:hypothetical protein